MPEVYNANVVRLISRGQMANQEILNVTHWQKVNVGPPTVADLNDIAARWVTWWTDEVRQIIGDEYVLTEVVAQSMGAPPANQTVYTLGLPVAGDLTGNLLPGNVAACVTISGGQTGRASRGRIYLAGLTEEATIGSIINVPTLTAINAAFGQLVLNNEGEPFELWQLGIYSTILDGAPRATGLFTPATTAQMRDNVVDSQRRRLPGRGR